MEGFLKKEVKERQGIAVSYTQNHVNNTFVSSLVKIRLLGVRLSNLIFSNNPRDNIDNQNGVQRSLLAFVNRKNKGKPIMIELDSDEDEEENAGIGLDLTECYEREEDEAGDVLNNSFALDEKEKNVEGKNKWIWMLSNIYVEKFDRFRNR
jgi:hypothetical protein